MDSQKHLFLPSEIARLVLGYLHDVNCKITYKSFLKESKDLAEYAALLKRGITYPTTIMGYTLVNLVNEYAAYKLQEPKEASSSSSMLWKQLEVVVKQLKKMSQSKLKQKETQTVRHRKLNKKGKNPKFCTSVLDAKETSDEGWVSDNSPFDTVTAETMHSDDSDVDEYTDPPFSKSSTSKNSSVLTLSSLSSPPNSKVHCKHSKNSANKSKSRESSKNESIEIDLNVNNSAVVKTSETSCKRTLRSSTMKKKQQNLSASKRESKETQSTSYVDSSVNSSILIINEDPSEQSDSSRISNCGDTSEFETHNVTEKVELNTIYEASDHCSNEVNVNNNSFCDVSMRCNGNYELQKDDNNAQQTVQANETFTVHSPEIHCQASQSNIVNVSQGFPQPVTTPQKSAFQPVNIDENSNLRTPVKTLSNLHFDHHYKSPRRKRPPRRRADNNITVMGGLSPDNTTCTQFTTNPPPGPDMDENTMTDYANMLDRMLEDTKLHEKLAENINKKLVPLQDNVHMKESILAKDTAPVNTTSGMNTDRMPSTSTGNGTIEQHNIIQAYNNEHQDIPTDNLSNDNLTSILGGVIKGIADVTGNDPSFESLFSLFMSVKESSVHDEVDQMIIQSNQDDLQNNQNDELHTPTDIKENFLINPENQQDQHPLSSQYLDKNNSNSQNQFDSTNTTSTVNKNKDVQLQQAHGNILCNQNQSCSELKSSTTNSNSKNGSTVQNIVCNSGNPTQTVNNLNYPVPFNINSNSNSQSALNQECYNIANSPAISVISINSPDPNSVSTPERMSKTRRPKRITPTPLNGTEILPLHGKIASPQKPLIIIPENKLLNSGAHRGKHFPPPTSNSNSRNSHYSDGHSDNSQHSTVGIELTAPLQSTLIGTGYPQFTQSQLNETCVSDITLSPGGQHLLAHNKRSITKAIEENSAFVLSPITPINENSKTASSTPYPNSIPACSSENSEKSPKKEFKKPNQLSKSVPKGSPKTASSKSDEDSVLCYSLSPLKTDANVIHGTVNDVPFTAVPMGQLSKRFCHVRNLDFGRAKPSKTNVEETKKRRSVNKSEKLDSKPKKNVLPKKISTDTPEKVEKVKVRPLLPRQTTPKPLDKSNQLAEPIATVNPESISASKAQVIQMSPQVILNRLETKPKAKEKRKSSVKAKTPKTPKPTTEPKPKKEKAKSKRKSDTKKASPEKANKVRSSSRKKSNTPKKMPPPRTDTVEIKNLQVNGPVDVIDILDADTKEFNQHLQDLNVVNYEIPIDLSAGSSTSQINISSVNEVSNQFVSYDQYEAKEAAEVLASLSMPNSFPLVSNDPFKPNSIPPDQDCNDQLVVSQSLKVPFQNNTRLSVLREEASDMSVSSKRSFQLEPTDLSMPKENKSSGPVVTKPSVNESENLTSGKRKAEDSITDSSNSPNLYPEPKKKKLKKKKSIDLRSVNIDALLSKIKYSK